MRGDGASAAFDDLHGMPRQQLHAQRGGGCLYGMALVTKDETGRLSLVGCHLQAAELGWRGMVGPADHGGMAGRAKTLLEGPERTGGVGAFDEIDMIEPHASALPRGCMRNEGRGDERNALLIMGETCQCRHQQVEFAQSPGWQQDLGQGARRPSARGQCCIEAVNAGANAGCGCMPGIGLPDLHLFEQGVQC